MKPAIPEIAVNKVEGPLKTSFDAAKAAREGQGQGMSDPNSTQLGKNPDALPTFQENPPREF